MQTSYIVKDNFDSIVFDRKEEAEKYLKKMCFDAVCDFKFSLDILRSFRRNYSNIQLFEKKVEMLIELAVDENAAVKELIKAWNEVFPEDKLEFIEKKSEM